MAAYSFGLFIFILFILIPIVIRFRIIDVPRGSSQTSIIANVIVPLLVILTHVHIPIIIHVPCAIPAKALEVAKNDINRFPHLLLKPIVQITIEVHVITGIPVCRSTGERKMCNILKMTGHIIAVIFPKKGVSEKTSLDTLCFEFLFCSFHLSYN